jgi:hypothetical protein
MTSLQTQHPWLSNRWVVAILDPVDRHELNKLVERAPGINRSAIRQATDKYRIWASIDAFVCGIFAIMLGLILAKHHMTTPFGDNLASLLLWSGLCACWVIVYAAAWQRNRQSYRLIEREVRGYDTQFLMQRLFPNL